MLRSQVTNDKKFENTINAKSLQIHLNGCQPPDRAKLLNAKQLTRLDRSCHVSGSQISSPVEKQEVEWDGQVIDQQVTHQLTEEPRRKLLDTSH